MSRSSLLLLALGIVVAAALLFLISRYSSNIATRTIPPEDLFQEPPVSSQVGAEPVGEYCDALLTDCRANCEQNSLLEAYQHCLHECATGQAICRQETSPEVAQALLTGNYEDLINNTNDEQLFEDEDALYESP